MLVGADAIQAAMRFIPKVFWYAGIRTTTSERFYDAVREDFDRSFGRPAAIPKLRNKAYLSAKALLQLAILVGNRWNRLR